MAPRTLAGVSERGTGDGSYVHGYHEREALRLRDQAGTLVDLLHADTAYPPASRVLEAGCGVGAQSVVLAGTSPGASIVSIDVSRASVAAARIGIRGADISNVELVEADLFHLPFDAGAFDHVFVCFVLEHLARPVEALISLKEVLRPGGTITVIEGDHGSAYFHPDDAEAGAAIACLIELQRMADGNALVGRQLHPLLTAAGFDAVAVSPRMVYVDRTRPDLVEGFTLKTFTAMVEGVRDEAVAADLIEPAAFDRGIGALRRTATDDGVFCYTFFKATARQATP